MTTTAVQVNRADGWVQVATADQDFLIDSRVKDVPIFVHLADSPPAADAPGHMMTAGQPFIRAGLTGAAYIRTDSEGDIDVIVST